MSDGDGVALSVNLKARRSLATVGAVVLAVTGVSVVTPVSASASQPSDPGVAKTVVSAVPSATTPSVDNGRVFAIAQNGSNVIIGGSFTTVGGVSHPKLAVFDRTTGKVNAAFAPAVNGDVETVMPGPTATTVYVGGMFTQVNGVAAQFVAELNTTDGSLVTSFKAPVFNYGFVYDLQVSGGRMFVAGTFTVVGGKKHAGLVSLNPTTGAVDPFFNSQFTGHHNDSGSGAQGWVGPVQLDITPDGKTMVVIGNFKYVDGLLHDQAALFDLSGSTAQLDPWNTTWTAGYCAKNAFDQWVRDVAISPDGSYFVIGSSGGGGVTPTSLCDSSSRFDINPSDTNAQPRWLNKTGNDTEWAVAITSTAVYVGGHNRWQNNPTGSDSAQAGSVPRGGIAALDPVSGLPLAWNPGRVPLGVAVFAMLATPQGIWIGSDQNYIGNYKYKRPKIAFFPYTGGYTPASTTTASLPATVYLANASGGSNSTLTKVAYAGAGSAAHSASGDTQGVDFRNWRGAFAIGGQVFYGYTDNYLYSRTFDGTTFGPAVKIDPYNDPYWSTIQTGDGQTFRGKVPSLYGQIGNLTGLVYSGGRIYYTLANDSRLFTRWFNPDAGVVGETTVAATSSVNFATASGLFISGSTLYYGSRSDQNLRAVTFTAPANGGIATVSGTPNVVSGPGVDGVSWSNRAMFLAASGPNTAPTAAFTPTCTDLSCTVDASASTDPDGAIAGYSWNYGDGTSTTSTAKTATHTYTDGGTYAITLTVTDNLGATATTTSSVTVRPANVAPTASFTGTCQLLSCRFDATASTDPDGSITSYAWTFGDTTSTTGDAGTAKTVTHDFTTDGSYTVTLTVTDDRDGTGSDSHSYTVASAGPGIGFVGAADSGGGNTTSKTVTIPATAQAGQTALLFLAQTSTATWSAPSGVTGWTQVATYSNSSLKTTVWQKTLTSSDPGAAVTFTTSTATHAAASIAVYSGLDTSNPVTRTAQSLDTAQTSHTSPGVTADDRDWILTYFADRSTATRTWTVPPTVRDTTTDTGTLTIQSALTDTNQPLTAGPQPGITATTDAPTDRNVAWTIELNAL